MIDIDKFKYFNDTYGHDLGDRILESVGEILRRSVDSDDLIARYGGDEFIIIINKNKPIDMEKFVEKINKNVDQFNQHSNNPFTLRLSIGVFVCDIKSGILPKDFLKALDENMYTNKKTKENIV